MLYVQLRLNVLLRRISELETYVCCDFGLSSD